MCGSSDIYQWSGRLPRHSVNFVTAHDGFTLWDLVSYDRKHNEPNGEGNRDGHDDNCSWNSGVEGPTDDPEVLALRRRRAKNMMATLMLSQGVPMVLAGDEFLRTQRGNNNAWCQDNEISWVNWGLAEENKDFLRFTREMIWLRRRHPALRRRRFFVGELRAGGPTRVVVPRGDRPEAGPFPPSGPVRQAEAGLPDDRARPSSDAVTTPAPMNAPALADIHWHGVEPYRPDFGFYSRTLAFALDADFYVALNAWHEAVKFRVPPSPTRRRWRRVVDTSREPPQDFVPEGEGPVVPEGGVYPVGPYSMVVLVSEP